jgi:hypothetical protein
MKTLSSLCTVLALSIPVAALGDALPNPIADLDCLVGAWKGGGTVTIGKDKSKIEGTWSCRRTSANHGVLCDLRLAGMPGVVSYEETDLFGWEPNSKTYHWYSVTNAGETHDHVGKAPAGNTAQFVYSGTQNGKAFREVVDFDFGKDASTVKIRGETFEGGVSTSVIVIDLKK